MLKKIKNIISKTDLLLYKKFGSDKSIKFLENLKEAKIIFSCLNEFGKDSKVKFVGGCVRKALCGETIEDIDLATSHEPEEVKKRLKQKDIKVFDTGISHGTVTAILNQKKFEITTLREDLSTDGRHANVKFSMNWNQDALRRDFTINAIYADMFGRIFDPLNGILDLQNGKIKFIGSPEERIKEDYLRILRYFRFFTQYSKIDHDKETIQSIKKNINGLNKISKERIFDELKKILTLQNIYNLFSNNLSREIILNIFPQFKFFQRLKVINTLSQKMKGEYDNHLILGLLIIDHSNNCEYFCYKYKTPNDIKKRFENVVKNFANLKDNKFYSEKNIKKLIYLSNKNEVKDLLLFAITINDQIKTSDIEKLIEYVKLCQVPKFPISGDYLKSKGYKTGEELGKKLKSLEKQWIENNFVLDKKLVERSLSQNS